MSKPPPRRDKYQGRRPAGPGASSGPADRERPGDPPAPPRTPSRNRPPDGAGLIWGTHAVMAALGSAARPVVRLFATRAAAERVAERAAGRGLIPDVVPAEAIAARVPRDAVHQGLLLEVRPRAALHVDDLPDAGVILVLDQITDPHNVGAILRSAAAFGATALVVTERHAPPLGGTLAKAASGALEHVPLVTVVNLARALDDLGRRGFQRIGLDSAGERTLDDVPLAPPLALVLGAEGTGMRRLTRERCDVVARLDMPGPIKSLNVSNATAVALTVLRLRGAF